MSVTKFNLSKPEQYQDKYGNTKTYWVNVGTMTEFTKQDGSINRIIEIPAINLKANVFPFKERSQGASQEQNQGRDDEGYNQAANQPEEPAIAYPAEDINPDDIPF